MHGGMRLGQQKINFARRNAITTAEDKLYAEKCDTTPKRLTMGGGVRIRLQKVKYAWKNVIITPEDKLCAEEREYDSKS